MLSAKEGAAPTAPKNNRQDESYTKSGRVSMKLERDRQISGRRTQIPRKYRRLYDRAISGKSLRASINAQCLECCQWLSKEIVLCSDFGCPLFAVRPYRNSGSAREGHLISVESMKSVTGGLWAGV